MRHASGCRWCFAFFGDCPYYDRPNYSSPASASPKSRDVQGGPPSPEIGEMQRVKKMICDACDEHIERALEAYRLHCDELQRKAVAEERAKEEEKQLRWRRNVQDAIYAQVDETWASGKAEGVAEERARWIEWATDLGYDEQELPRGVKK